MMRLLWLSLLTVSCGSIQAPGHSVTSLRVLTPAAEAGFRKVMSQISGGALGPRVTRADIGVRENSATLTLWRPDGGSATVYLRSRTSGEVCSRFFSLSTAKDATAEELDAVATLLDEAFPRSPWTGEEGPETVPPANHRCDSEPLLEGLARGESGRMYALSTLMGACLLLAWGVLLAWRDAPLRAPGSGKLPSDRRISGDTRLL
jgi:hypothetical protein